MGGLARSHDRRFWGRRKEMFWVWGWFRIVWGSWFHLCTNTLRDTLCEFCVHVLHGVVGMASAHAARRRRDGLGFGGWGPKHMAPGRCVVGLRDQPCNPTSGIFWAVLGPRSSPKKTASGSSRAKTLNCVSDLWKLSAALQGLGNLILGLQKGQSGVD